MPGWCPQKHGTAVAYSTGRTVPRDAGRVHSRRTGNANPHETMKSQRRSTQARSMTPDAYAGFIQLLLTPATRVPRESADLDAYLRYLSAAEPLSEASRMVLGQPTVEAA